MAAEYKDKGNDAYKAANYDKAVEFYTSGIEHEPNNAALFSNRSAAYLKLEDYEKARRDAEMCIELDRSWSKVSLQWSAASCIWGACACDCALQHLCVSLRRIPERSVR